MDKHRKRKPSEIFKPGLKQVENLAHLLDEERDEPLPDEIHRTSPENQAESLQKSRNAFLKLMEPPTDPVKRRKWFRKRMLTLAIFIAIAILAIIAGLDKPVIAGALLVIGIISQLFTGILALIGLVPVVGPMLVGALSLPFIWLMNGLGYLLSLKLAAAGKGRDVLNWRTVAVVFVAGIAIGIVIGRILPQ